MFEIYNLVDFMELGAMSRIQQLWNTKIMKRGLRFELMWKKRRFKN
jgi:hypothetical protein